jgi:predicted membrane protein
MELLIRAFQDICTSIVFGVSYISRKVVYNICFCTASSNYIEVEDSKAIQFIVEILISKL